MTSAVSFLIIPLLVAAFTAQAQCRKTVPWNNDSLLQTNSKEELQLSRDLKLLKRALTKLDCQINFVKMPWARSIVEIENGRIDILDGAFKTKERQRFAWYSDFSFETRSVLFMRKKDIGKYSLNTLQDIAKYQLRIGTQIGAIYSHEFNQLLKDETVTPLIFPNSSRKALWNMLKIGRVDGFISELHLGLIELKSLNFIEQIIPTELVISTQPTHFIFSKQSVDYEFFKAVDRELIKLRESDSIKLD